MPGGQFGTRLLGERCSTVAVHSHNLNPITRSLFCPLDEPLYYLDDDGFKIEPEAYCPILPTVLINAQRVSEQDSVLPSRALILSTLRKISKPVCRTKLTKNSLLGIDLSWAPSISFPTHPTCPGESLRVPTVTPFISRSCHWVGGLKNTGFFGQHHY